MKAERATIEDLVGLLMNCELGDAITCAAAQGRPIHALVAEAAASFELSLDAATLAAVAAGISEDPFVLFQRRRLGA